MAIKVGNINVGNKLPMLLIAGPCVIESAGRAQDVAGSIAEITKQLGIPFIYKSSFDKANRTSGSSYRGPGVDEGLSILESIKQTIGVPVLTDVHEDTPLEEVARQTNFILNVAKQNKPMNIKKGQFLSPWEMQNVVDKAKSVNNQNVLVCERGYTFGYNNLVADMRSLIILRETGCPVIFDSTHSLQLPGGQGSSSGGQKQYIPSLARAAVATGVAGIFIETHPDPDSALSDGPNSLPLNQLAPLLHVLKEIDSIVKQNN